MPKINFDTISLAVLFSNIFIVPTDHAFTRVLASLSLYNALFSEKTQRGKLQISSLNISRDALSNCLCHSTRLEQMYLSTCLFDSLPIFMKFQIDYSRTTCDCYKQQFSLLKFAVTVERRFYRELLKRFNYIYLYLL